MRSNAHRLATLAPVVFAILASCSGDGVTNDGTRVPAGGAGGVSAAGHSNGGGGVGAAGSEAGGPPDVRGGASAAGSMGGSGSPGGGGGPGGGAVGGSGGAGDPGGAGGAAGGGLAGTEAGSAGAAGKGAQCPTGLPGAKLSAISRADGRTACIDEREVTQGEYRAFVQAVGNKGFYDLGYCDPSSLEENVPEPTGGSDDVLVFGSCEYGAYQPDATPEAPVGCLAHCHAASYCKWAGKELCGGFDDDETLTEEEALDPARSIWANACTNGGKTDTSHADADPEACGPPRQFADAQKEPVVSYPECHGQGAYAGIRNLSGGVAEWINARQKPFGQQATGSWMKVGPAFGLKDDEACGASNAGGLRWSVGFRCCARLP